MDADTSTLAESCGTDLPRKDTQPPPPKFKELCYHQYQPKAKKTKPTKLQTQRKGAQPRYTVGQGGGKKNGRNFSTNAITQQTWNRRDTSQQSSVGLTTAPGSVTQTHAQPQTYADSAVKQEKDHALWLHTHTNTPPQQVSMDPSKTTHHTRPSIFQTANASQGNPERNTQNLPPSDDQDSLIKTYKQLDALRNNLYDQQQVIQQQLDVILRFVDPAMRQELDRAHRNRLLQKAPAAVPAHDVPEDVLAILPTFDCSEPMSPCVLPPPERMLVKRRFSKQTPPSSPTPYHVPGRSSENLQPMAQIQVHTDTSFHVGKAQHAHALGQDALSPEGGLGDSVFKQFEELDTPFTAFTMSSSNSEDDLGVRGSRSLDFGGPLIQPSVSNQASFVPPPLQSPPPPSALLMFTPQFQTFPDDMNAMERRESIASDVTAVTAPTTPTRRLSICSSTSGVTMLKQTTAKQGKAKQLDITVPREEVGAITTLCGWNSTSESAWAEEDSMAEVGRPCDLPGPVLEFELVSGDMDSAMLFDEHV